LLEQVVKAGIGSGELLDLVAVFFGTLTDLSSLRKHGSVQQEPYREQRTGCQTDQRLGIRESFNKYYG
jgi:hypothetical protein